MVNKATMESPFYTMFGYDPNVPLWKEADVAYRPDPVDNPGPAHKAKQQLVRKAAHQANQHHQQKALEQDAKHHRTELHIFESGDLVWVRNSVSNASNKKLDGHKWEEGVIIKQLSPVTYRVRREGRKRKREATLNVKYLKPRQDTLLLPEAEQEPEEEEAEPEPDQPPQMSDEEEEQLTSEEEEEEDEYRPPPHVRPQTGATRQTLPRAAKRPMQEDAIAATSRQKRRRRLLELSEAELARLSEAELYAYVHGDLQLKRPDGAHKFMLQQRGQQQQLQQGEDWPDLEPGTPDQAPAAPPAPATTAPPAGPTTPMQRERRHLETFNNPGRSEQQGPLPERRHGRQPVVNSGRTAPGQSWPGVGISKVNLQHRIGLFSGGQHGNPAKSSWERERRAVNNSGRVSPGDQEAAKSEKEQTGTQAKAISERSLLPTFQDESQR